MKKYYEFHENAYKQILSKGSISWDGATSFDSMASHETKEFLERTIQQHFPNTTELHALDLGCGTGTTAFYLEKQGFRVTGVDISESAIRVATQLARQHNSFAQFVVGDVLGESFESQKFDFIYDSHCFHCIVFDKDRSRFLKTAKSALSQNGILALDTMVFSEAMDIAEGNGSLRFDDDFILWHKVRPAENTYGTTTVESQNWCAQRRVYPESRILREVADAGFNIVSKDLQVQGAPHPDMLRLVLKK